MRLKPKYPVLFSSHVDLNKIFFVDEIMHTLCNVEFFKRVLLFKKKNVL